MGKFVHRFHHDFIKDNTVIKDLPSGWTLIAPPVFGIFNDGLEIYIKKENNNIRFSDDSITLQNLSLLGISIKRIATQIDYVLLKYGLQKVKDEICLEVSENDFAKGFYYFLSGLIELNGLKSI